jgi:quinol monooxygenase YgiN
LIKAILTLHGIVMPRVHDLEFLYRLLPAAHRFSAAASDLAWLSTYGIERWWDPDAAQASRALDVATEIRAAAAAVLEAELGKAG